MGSPSGWVVEGVSTDVFNLLYLEATSSFPTSVPVSDGSKKGNVALVHDDRYKCPVHSPNLWYSVCLVTPVGPHVFGPSFSNSFQYSQKKVSKVLDRTTFPSVKRHSMRSSVSLFPYGECRK